MNRYSFIASAFIALTPAFCSAEILQNIEPLDSLGDIKLKYPNAVLTRVKAAWVTEDQDFFKLTGQGFPGELFIAFNDSRPGFRKLVTATKKGWKNRVQMPPRHFSRYRRNWQINQMMTR